MNKDQKLAVTCAFADLCGALQAFHQLDIHTHDWRAHQRSIEDLMDAFPNLNLTLPEDLLDSADA